MKDGRKRGLKLHEQVMLWIAAFLVFGAVVTHLPVEASETFEVVPDSVITVTNALGIVLMSYGIWALWRAFADRETRVGTAAFLLPFVGIATWSAPLLVEVLLR